MVPEKGLTDMRSVKYKIEPTAASTEPMAKVMLMMRLILMPMIWLVSKSRLTARIAMPSWCG